MSLTITNENQLSPLELYLTKESSFSLSPTVYDAYTDAQEIDGNIDMGSRYGNFEETFVCISKEGLTIAQKYILKLDIAEKLNDFRNGGWLYYQSHENKRKRAYLSSMVEYENEPGWLKVTIPFTIEPYWESTIEKTANTSGTITNEGNKETPFIVEVVGVSENPEIVVNGETMKWTGILSSLDNLVINTDKMTVIRSDIINALKDYEGDFPTLPPGDSSIILPENTVLKWRDRWL